MSKIYVDTNIFMDYWLDRSNKSVPFGLRAKTMLDDTVMCRHVIVISDYIIAELNENLTFFREVKDFFDELVLIDKLEIVKITQGVIDKAKILAKEKKIPIHDAIHALVAESRQAVIITRDAHFQNLTDIITVLRPEDLTI